MSRWCGNPNLSLLLTQKEETTAHSSHPTLLCRDCYSCMWHKSSSSATMTWERYTLRPLPWPIDHKLKIMISTRTLKLCVARGEPVIVIRIIGLTFFTEILFQGNDKDEFWLICSFTYQLQLFTWGNKLHIRHCSGRPIESCNVDTKARGNRCTSSGLMFEKLQIGRDQTGF